MPLYCGKYDTSVIIQMFMCCLHAFESKRDKLHVRFLSRVISLFVLPRLPPPAVLLKSQKYKGSMPLHTFQMHSQDELSSRIPLFEYAK